MKRLHLLGAGVGSAALLLSGAAMATPPSGHAFNNWAAFEGRVILNPDAGDLAGITAIGDFENVNSNCTPPACVVLLNEVGLLQARVRADDDPNAMGYFQTINVEDNFSGLPSAASFRNENFVEGANGGFPLSGLTYVEFDNGDFGQTYLNSGNLQEAGQPFMEMYQHNGLDGFADANFYFERMNRGGDTTGYQTGAGVGASLRIDYLPPAGTITGSRQSAMSIRQASGFYTQNAGELALADGTVIAFNAGDHIGTVFGVGRTWHGGQHHTGGSDNNRHLEMQNISNFTTDETASWSNVNNTMDDTGVGVVNFQAAWQDAYALDNRLWNVDAFGPAPDYIAVNGAVDPTTVFPGTPDHADQLFDFGL